MSNMKVHVLRLEPGQEVRKSLEEYVHREAPSGVVVMTCCGSITSATLRLASKTDGSNKIETFKKHFEVLGMSGTISKGGTHLHICLSDEEGGTLGGHVMGDLVVFTTMEVALGEVTDIKLSREYDSSTGFDELTVTKNQV